MAALLSIVLYIEAMAPKRKRPASLGPEAVRPVRGGVSVKRAHDLSPKNGVAAPIEPGVPAREHDTPASALPPLYAAWMAELLPGPIPNEPHATCDDCAMGAPNTGRAGTEDTLYFEPSTKCCTLVPTLPNYLVGRVLADRDEDDAAVAGRASVLARIDARRAVTPLGLDRTLGFTLHYRHHAAAFGQNRALRCPHYVEDGGRCGVWRHRSSTCATWFCKHERGAVAVRFWGTLDAVLCAVERALALWCVRELGLDTPAVRELYRAGAASLDTSRGTFATHLLDGQLGSTLANHRLGGRDLHTHEDLWGAWAGREVELYLAAAQRVNALTWSGVSAIVAPFLPQLEAGVRLLGERYLALCSQALPVRVASRGDELELVQLTRRTLRVDSYRAHDPVEVSREVLGLLPYFDGRDTQEALRAIEAEAGVAMEPALVRKLVDFGLLVDDTPETG